jgi:hypothetical protein
MRYRAHSCRQHGHARQTGSIDPHFSGLSGPLVPSSRLACPLWAHSCPQSYQIIARHPQIRQLKQGGDLRRILLKFPVAGLNVAKLALVQPKLMLDLGANTSLELLDLIQQLSHLPGLHEGFALAWTHGHLPSHGGIRTWALFNTLIPGIGPYSFRMSVQQPVCLGDVLLIAAGAAHRMNQTGICINSDMRLHAKVPLVTFLAGMHQGVSGLVLVFGRTRCSDQGGADCAVFFEHLAALAQHRIDFSQDFDCHAVFLQPVIEPQDGAFVGEYGRCLPGRQTRGTA